ncbi:HAD family hydrolase [Paenibacillus humicola]|uniref:HAD family hydrolase n=1 Tax=Paenibacillus humicola TaxID=3110540 RepID=UPI00237A451E|nr:HAD family hydrolase [Paenibacillus humicola]
MRLRTLLFDLDGTLTDPKEGITNSIVYALRRFEIHVDDPDRLKPFIGPPLAGSFRERFGFSEAEAARAVSYYREYFSEKGLFENELYAGVPELLEELKHTGFRLLIATSKPAVYAGRIADHFGIGAYFEHIGGSELDGTRSDKTELIAHLLGEFGIEAGSAAMIGDRKHDIVGARNNGVAGIGVGYGYGSERELREAGASAYAPDIAALKKMLLAG